MKVFCIPVLFCFLELFAGKKNHMATGSEHQNFFPICCRTKLLFSVLSLERKEMLTYLDSIFMPLAQYELLTAG